MDDARLLASEFAGPPGEIEEALRRLVVPLIAWAPPDNGQTIKVVHAFRKVSSTGQVQPIALAIPLDMPPGVRTVHDIADVWTHPILQQKFYDVASHCFHCFMRLQRSRS